MRICLAAVGSRGDVAPFAEVGHELAARGHRVRLVTLDDQQQPSPGVEVVPVGLGTRQALWPQRPALLTAAMAQPGVMYGLMRHQLGVAAPLIARALVQASADCELLVAGTATRGAVNHIAASRGARAATLLLAPLLPGPDGDSSVLAPSFLPRPAAGAVAGALWSMTATMGAAIRDEVRTLAPAGAAAGPEVLVTATSSTLAPRRGAGGGHHVGWIQPRHPGSTRLDPGLEGFLRDHPGAVLAGFGSCPSPRPGSELELFTRAARHCRRALVTQVRDQPEGLLAPDVWNVHDAPHVELLPRVAAVVHHGGAGTTCQVLAAGTPAVVVPHLGDQAWFARRIQQLGAGVASAPRWRLTPGRLGQDLAAVLAGAHASRAGQLAPALRAEATGAVDVADLLERLSVPGRG